MSVKSKIDEFEQMKQDLTLKELPIEAVQGLHSIAAVMENRANEIGIAVLTPDLNCVTMTQLVDTNLYQHTLNFLKLMEVKTVIFSQSLIGTALHFILSG